jgi:hypothetical protein
MSTTVALQRRLPASPPPRERAALERRVRMLAWGGNAWHVVEFAIAVGAGVAAGSVALIGFGIDSVVEALAGGVIVWLFSGGRGASDRAEGRSQQLIAATYAILVVYIGVARRELRLLLTAPAESALTSWWSVTGSTACDKSIESRMAICCRWSLVRISASGRRCSCSRCAKAFLGSCAPGRRALDPTKSDD